MNRTLAEWVKLDTDVLAFNDRRSDLLRLLQQVRGDMEEINSLLLTLRETLDLARAGMPVDSIEPLILSALDQLARVTGE